MIDLPLAALNDSYAVFVAQQAVIAAVPLILAGTGELVAQRAGVINVGIEGLMLAGAFSAYLAAATLASGPAGLVAALLAGTLLALLFAAVTIWARADQIVAGTAINLIAAGLTTTAWSHLQTAHNTLPPNTAYTRAPIPLLSDLPLLGPVLFSQFTLFYALTLLLILTALTLRHTRAGIILRALGDAPDAVAAAGLSVKAWRTAAVLFAGATAGLAGAYLSIMRTHSFQPNMTGGQGFLVLALVIFGRWNPWGLAAGCLLFGILDSLGRLARSWPPTASIPTQTFDALPYVATLLALTLLARSRAGPKHLGQPW